MPRSLRELTRSPLAIIGLAGLGGWLLGSGIFALPLPALGSGAIAPHATAAPGESPTPQTLPASSSVAATISTSSAAMPPAGGPTDDPFAGYLL